MQLLANTALLIGGDFRHFALQADLPRNVERDPQEPNSLVRLAIYETPKNREPDNLFIVGAAKPEITADAV